MERQTNGTQQTLGIRKRTRGLYDQLIFDESTKNTHWVKVSLRNGYSKAIYLQEEITLLSHTIPNNQLKWNKELIDLKL